ncbi:hypothetical protein LguiB_026652 [Lonicera macranthoides]
MADWLVEKVTSTTILMRLAWRIDGTGLCAPAPEMSLQGREGRLCLFSMCVYMREIFCLLERLARCLCERCEWTPVCMRGAWGYRSTKKTTTSTNQPFKL